MIRGYKGADQLTGDDGADRYTWERKDLDAVDTITDFDASEDVLDFSNLVKATAYDDVSDVVRIEAAGAGSMVSVYSGSKLGWQDVVILDRTDADVATLSDDGALLV